MNQHVIIVVIIGLILLEVLLHGIVITTHDLNWNSDVLQELILVLIR